MINGNNKILILFVALTALLFNANFVVAQDEALTIRDIKPNGRQIRIGNKILDKGSSFSPNDTIHWDENGGFEIRAISYPSYKPYIFSKSSFESKNARTVFEFLHSQGSSRNSTAGTSIIKGVKNSELFPEKRIALVIGNANYDYLNYLKNSFNDVDKISTKLLSLGFDVISKYDCNQTEMKTVVNFFFAESKNYDVALLYFAGHGLQDNGINYLLPCDIDMVSSASLKSAISMNDLVSRANNNEGVNNLFFIDACRDATPTWRRGTNTILSNQIEAPAGTSIMYSTASGQTAEDGDKENSPFASAFLSKVGVPGQPIALTMDEIRLAVRNTTNPPQNPIVQNNITSSFFFVHNGKGMSSVIAQNGSTPLLVSFKINPSVASVIIDDTPCPVQDDGSVSLILGKGSHSYKINSSGYISENGVFELTDENVYRVINLRVDPKPIFGAISAISNPDGAIVLLDGKEMGITPLLKEDIPLGKHTVEFQKDGFRPIWLEVNIMDNKPKEVVVELSEGYPVSIESIPSKASLVIDGKPKGKTPFNNYLTSGTHAIQLNKWGYNTLQKNIDVDSVPTILSLNLNHRYLSLNDIYAGGNLIFGHSSGAEAFVGLYYKSFNIEAGFSGFYDSPFKVWWITDESLSSGSDGLEYEYRIKSSVSAQLGYGVLLGNRTRITPLLGLLYSDIEGKYMGSQSGMNQNTYVINGRIGVRAEYSPLPHVSFVCSPLYDIPLIKGSIASKLNSSTSFIRERCNGFAFKLGLELLL